MAPDQSGPASLSWKAHPLIDESRPRSTLLCALIAGCSIGAALSFDDLAYGLIALAVLTLSLSRYLLPTRYGPFSWFLFSVSVFLYLALSISLYLSLQRGIFFGIFPGCLRTVSRVGSRRPSGDISRGCLRAF